MVLDKKKSGSGVRFFPEKPIFCQNKHKIFLQKINILSSQLKESLEIDVQTRYRQKPTKAIVENISLDEETITLKPVTSPEIVTPGQSCVLYLDEVCLGGGIIAS